MRGYILSVLVAHLSVCSRRDFGYASTVNISRNQSRENVDFCHVNDFGAPSTSYKPIPYADVRDVTPGVLLSYAETGQPFVVRNVANEWKAREKWNERYFQTVFANFELFSSTFATNASPTFDSVLPKKDVYYGIFINDKELAGFMSEDYEYPWFVPNNLRMQGKCNN